MPEKAKEMEIYLSGYVDGELPQQQRQEVEALLERDPEMREMVDKLRSVKQKAGKMSFETPSGEEWADLQNSIAGRASRRLGWLLIWVWVAMVFSYAAYWYAFETEHSLWHKVGVFGLISGLGLLFFSVLSERWKASRTDRYKGVHR